MSHSLWTIISWLFFLIYLSGFGLVSKWPECRAKTLMLIFFGVEILCNLCYKVPAIGNLLGGMDMLYNAIPLVQLGAMVCMLLALGDLGSHFTAPEQQDNKDQLL